MSMFTPDPEIPARLLRACPAYRETPLVEILHDCGCAILIKDESRRMNLGSFKALGGVYAVARLIAAQWQQKMGSVLPLEDLFEAKVKTFASTLTFVCASAGNHGLAVAAGARLFGAKARIYLSREVSDSFQRRLVEQKAEIIRCGLDYDESIACASQDAANTGAILLADGSWDGYTEAPSLIMEGYTVIAEELRATFEQHNDWPSHVYLQAGVGGFAAAMAHMIRSRWARQPKIFVVEPDAARCLQASRDAGRPVRITGPISSMGRLDCKEASLIAHAVLQQADVEFLAVSDIQASVAVDMLAEKGLKTTPSGAAGFAGLLSAAKGCPQQSSFRPLVFMTEGAGDVEHPKAISHLNH